MFESSSVLAINSQSEVLLISSPEKSAAKFFKNLEKIFAKNEIAPPQILFIQPSSTGHSVYLTAPQENLEMIKNCLTENKQFRVSRNELCSVSATCSGATDSQTIQTVLDLIDKNKIAMKAFFQSAMSSVVIVEQKDRDKTIQTLHQLIDKPVQI